MKGIFTRVGQTPPILGTLALLLAVVAVVTTPLAVSKYVATGTGSAGARIAKWDPGLTDAAAADYEWFYTATGAVISSPASLTRNFTLTNNSEVMANYPLNLYYTTSPSGTPNAVRGYYLYVDSVYGGGALDGYGSVSFSLGIPGSTTGHIDLWDVGWHDETYSGSYYYKHRLDVIVSQVD